MLCCKVVCSTTIARLGDVMMIKKILQFATSFFFGGVVLVHADNWISTALGGAFPNGYAGSMITTTTTVIRGSVICKQGFQVPSGGALLYDADGPVYDKVEFLGSDGTLILASDLRLGATAELRSSVDDAYLTVNGGSDQNTSLSNKIILQGDTRLTFTLRLKDSSLVIDGQGNTLQLDAPIRLEFTSNPTSLTLQNMRLVIKNPGLSGSAVLPFDIANPSNLLFVYGDIESLDPYPCRVVLQDVDICLPPEKTVQWPAICQLLFKNSVKLLGQGGIFKASYINQFCRPMIIDQHSSLYVGHGVTLSFWGAAVLPDAKLGLTASTSSLWLDGCMLDISTADNAPNPGLFLGQSTSLPPFSTGCIYFDNKVTVSSTVAGQVESGLWSVFTQPSPFNLLTPYPRGFACAADYVDVRVRSGAYVNAIGTMQYFSPDPLMLGIGGLVPVD